MAEGDLIPFLSPSAFRQRDSRMTLSPPTYKTFDAGQQKRRVERDSVCENDLDVVNVGDVLIRSTTDNLQIRFLTDRDGASAILYTEKRRTVEGGHANGLERTEPDPDHLPDSVVGGESRHTPLSQRVRIGTENEPAARPSESQN
jgi:hypothetical protein